MDLSGKIRAEHRWTINPRFKQLVNFLRINVHDRLKRWTKPCLSRLLLLWPTWPQTSHLTRSSWLPMSLQAPAFSIQSIFIQQRCSTFQQPRKVPWSSQCQRWRSLNLVRFSVEKPTTPGRWSMEPQSQMPSASCWKDSVVLLTGRSTRIWNRANFQPLELTLWGQKSLDLTPKCPNGQSWTWWTELRRRGRVSFQYALEPFTRDEKPIWVSAR